ncbi:MAG: hypothetical protein RIE77_08850 [Phycisphaerales bacterium]
MAPYSPTDSPAGSQQTEASGAEGEPGAPGHARYPRVRTPEEVFVSPRVVDRVAFEDYAQALRKLLAAATTEGEHLRRTAVDASRSLRAIGEVLPAVDKKLAKAGEMLSTLTQRLESAESTAKRAEAAAERAVTAERRIKEMDDRARQRIFEAGTAAVDEAIARVEEVAEKRANELDDRGETLTTFVDRGRADLAEARAKAVEALQRVAENAKSEADAGLRAVQDRADEAQRAIAQEHSTAAHEIGQARNDSVEAIGSERKAAEAAMAERIEGLSQRLASLIEDAEGRLAQVIATSDAQAGERVDEVGERIEREIAPKLAEAEANADAVLDRVDQIDTKARGVFELDLDGIESLCERAEALIESTGAGSSKPADGTLAAVAAQAMAAMEQMDDVATAGERARRQAEESRKALSESIESAGLWLDRLVEQRDGLQQSISLATKLCEQAEGQLSQRRAELDEAMRAPATEVKRHLDTLKTASEEAEAKRAALADLIEESEKRAEKRANAAADKAADKAIHKAKIESEKLDAKATQARQALDQAWKTLETRLKGELKESLTALSAEAKRAERARLGLREDIEAARQVEKETRAAISKPAAPSSVDQLNKLANLMQDLAERTSGKKPAVAKATPAAPEAASAPTNAVAAASITKKSTKKVSKKATASPATATVTKKAAPKKPASKKATTKKATTKKPATKKAPARKKAGR